MNIEYELLTVSLSPSLLLFTDDFMDNDQMESSNDGRVGINWDFAIDSLNSGESYYTVTGNFREGEAYLTAAETWRIEDDFTTLRFDHNFNTQTGIDGGVVEVTADGGQSWQYLSNESFLFGGYNDAISFNFFYTDILPAFSGLGSRMTSYVDLSDYRGEEVNIRFRYIMQDVNDKTIADNWQIYNVQLLSRASLEGQACVSANNSPVACDSGRTILEAEERTTSTQELLNSEFDLSIYPNPAGERLNISFNPDHGGELIYTIFSQDGQTLSIVKRNHPGGLFTDYIDTSTLPAGMYILDIQMKDASLRKRFIVE
jgi:hypothetical protein